MSSRRVAFTALAALVIGAFDAHSARADFSLVSQSLSLTNTEQQAHFTLTFNQAPNFSSSDSCGRQADSFQVEFDGAYNGDPTSFTEDQDTAVIRGEEIHLANALRVRSPVGSGGAGSGGWGPILTTVPFTLTGDTVAFTVPTKDLGLTGTDYRYTVSSYTYGSQTAVANVRVVPLPPAAAMGAIGLLGAGVATVFARRRVD